ncbi:490_t:CDS:2 [Cetraspora pellucida]|uniref:490_t:CDS:1 n=1 Tax=Cetraspora pellucida TaxID=1433469 RepID=A0ACA9Q7M8_9GLOM|nr:490_t:CDS:2 [Cetraspora pellucida]
MPVRLRPDATYLSPEEIHDIIASRNIPNAMQVLSKKYNISYPRIYKIWEFAVRKMVGINTRGTDCTDAEWIEHCNMPQVRTNETPSEENDLLPIESKKYLEARRLIRLPNSSSYAPEIGIAICFSCDQLVYTGQRKKNIGNYNHLGMERHWKFLCTGNKYCGVNYEEYLKIKQESNSGYDYDSKYALHRYGLWMQNAIKKAERAREIGKKIQACITIQRKWIEFMYRPDGMMAKQLAKHYQLLWAVREEMHQINNAQLI